MLIMKGRRALKERHVNMIAFSFMVGIGMFLGAGKVIYYAGPGLTIFAYLITGTVMWSAMACLGEMTALFPVMDRKRNPSPIPAASSHRRTSFNVGWDR